MNMSGRTFVVTGASRGIGAATARALGDRGATTALLARSRSDLDTVATDVETAGGSATVFSIDLAEPEACATVADRIRDTYDRIDGVVCCAGVGDWTSVPETDHEQARRMMDVTYQSAFGLTREFLPEMLARDQGGLAFVTSPAAYVPVPGATAYTASRWAIRGFAEALRTDLYSTDILVTLVVPGLVDTNYFQANENVRERMPGTPREVSPDRIGRAIIDGLENERSYVVEPFETWLAVGGSRIAPGLIRRYMTRVGWQPDA